jgi:hypothetical protein
MFLSLESHVSLCESRVCNGNISWINSLWSDLGEESMILMKLQRVRWMRCELFIWEKVKPPMIIEDSPLVIISQF